MIGVLEFTIGVGLQAGRSWPLVGKNDAYRVVNLLGGARPGIKGLRVRQT